MPMVQRTVRIFAMSIGVATLFNTVAVQAGVTCPSNPQLLSQRIQSSELENRFGIVPGSSKPLKFAYVTQLLEDPFWIEVQKGLKSEAERRGISINITAPKNRSSESEQLQVAEAALSQNPDVLILTGINGTNLSSVIERANTQGIPTVSINLKSNGVRVHIGTDHVALGTKAAEFLHEYFPAGAKVAEIEGEVSSPYRIDRVKGFLEGVKVYPNLTLVANATADWDRDKAKAATLKIMAANPDVSGIYANSDLMAIGAVDALASLGKLESVVVVGTDGVVAAKTSIADGKLKGTTAQFPVKEGALAIEVGLRLLGCQPLPGWVVSPQSVMTAKSLPDYAIN